MEIIFQYEILIQQMVEQGLVVGRFFWQTGNVRPEQLTTTNTMTMLSAGRGISKGQAGWWSTGEMNSFAWKKINRYQFR
jgi:hypothetical protein